MYSCICDLYRTYFRTSGKKNVPLVIAIVARIPCKRGLWLVVRVNEKSGSFRSASFAEHRNDPLLSHLYTFNDQISAIFTSVSSFARFSILVTSALAVSTAVRTVTPVSIALRRITKPS